MKFEESETSFVVTFKDTFSRDLSATLLMLIFLIAVIFAFIGGLSAITSPAFISTTALFAFAAYFIVKKAPKKAVTKFDKLQKTVTIDIQPYASHPLSILLTLDEIQMIDFSTILLTASEISGYKYSRTLSIVAKNGTRYLVAKQSDTQMRHFWNKNKITVEAITDLAQRMSTALDMPLMKLDKLQYNVGE